MFRQGRQGRAPTPASTSRAKPPEGKKQGVRNMCKMKMGI